MRDGIVPLTLPAAPGRNRFFLLPPAARLRPGDHRPEPGCLLGALHRPVHLPRRDRGVGGDAGQKAIQTLAQIVAYALATSIFFVLVELFTAYYSQIPGHMHHMTYLFAGLEGHNTIARWMSISACLAVAALTLLIIPRTRRNEPLLALACVGVFVALWIEKGLGLVVTGFVPSPLEKITDYTPTVPEVGITIGVWAMGLLLITFFYKIFISVRAETGTDHETA